MITIGLPPCFFHADPQRPIFKGKTLLYLEQSMAHWIESQGALPFLIPSIDRSTGLHPRDFIQHVDGIVLQGGADMAPESYGETPLDPQWSGDRVRDQLETEYFFEAMAQNKPILGICRGAQVINVALGGSLYQDITTQVPNALVHRSWDLYDQNFHHVVFEPHSRISRLYPGKTGGLVNSVHHQGIKNLASNLIVEARSEQDGIIEAFRLDSEQYVYAVQWHPEFQDPTRSDLLLSSSLLEDFLDAVRKRKVLPS